MDDSKGDVVHVHQSVQNDSKQQTGGGKPLAMLMADRS